MSRAGILSILGLLHPPHLSPPTHEASFCHLLFWDENNSWLHPIAFRAGLANLLVRTGRNKVLSSPGVTGGDTDAQGGF